MTYTVTSTLSTVLDRLSQNVGDYLSETVTTAIAANTSLVCTTLVNYTNRDRNYERHWAYIVDKANAGVYRKVSTSLGTGTIILMGANLASDSANLATFQLHKIDRNLKIRAINMAARECFPYLFKFIRDTSLTGDSDLSEYTLPDSLQSPLSYVGNVYSQSSGGLTDDVHDCNWSPVYNYRTQQDGSTRKLVSSSVTDNQRILIEGASPLEDTLSTASDTITLVDPLLATFIEYASYRLMMLYSSLPTGEDRGNILESASEHMAKYKTMPKMTTPQTKQRLTGA